eukprot:398039-Rhodomonas_salina.2
MRQCVLQRAGSGCAQRVSHHQHPLMALRVHVTQSERRARFASGLIRTRSGCLAGQSWPLSGCFQLDPPSILWERARGQA